MLSYLHVRNLAVLEEVALELGPGLNLITGETGAGKSVLLTALQLALGGRARPELVRTGAARAEITAAFELSGDAPARRRLAELGVDEADEVILRRVVEASGRARAWINGQLATLTQVGAVARLLVDLSAQHEPHTLADPSSHLAWLDAYAELDGAPMRTAFSAAREARAALDALRTARDADRADVLRFQLGELDAVALPADAEAEAQRLRHADTLGRTIARVEDHLGGDAAILTRLARACAELEGAARTDPSLAPLVAQLVSARAEVEDVADGVARYARHVEADPARLAELEEKLHEDRRLRRKFGDDLAAVRRRLAEELDSLADLDDRLVDAEATVAAADARVQVEAKALRVRREAAATALGAAISAELRTLGMPDALLTVGVSDAPVGPRGADRVDLLFAPNQGEAARPLADVASGGELSRTLLAIKRVLARVDPVGVYVFDEVDTGVGGAIAEVIGHKLAEVARRDQVICITHAPQIAARADVHLHVRKTVGGGRTRSEVRRLDDGEQLEEIARMLGGVRVGAAARAAARELRVGAA